jgi:hypothetical protein
MKTCLTCGNDLPADAFYSSPTFKKLPYGLSPNCKECSRAYHRKVAARKQRKDNAWLDPYLRDIVDDIYARNPPPLLSLLRLRAFLDDRIAVAQGRESSELSTLVEVVTESPVTDN